MSRTSTETAHPAQVRAADSAHLWHPYTTVPAAETPYVVTGTEGVHLDLWSDGQRHRVVDGMSSWWSAIHGYRHPRLDAAVHAQVDRFSHVMFGGLTHAPAAALAEALVAITPDGLDHVFLADSGSVSVEVAMKMCLQYHRSTGNPGRRRFLTWRGGYHGDTFHAMSVCDPDGGMHSLWGDVLPGQVYAPAPPAGFDSAPDPDYLAGFAELAREHAGELAAIIVEPVVQGAGGMRFHHPGYLRELRGIADEHGILLVFDEIATGFGRTGEMFAADHAGVVPDVLCLGKALTGGYMTLAATLCTARVARGIAEGEVPVLAHGPTFMGNPLACATALASVELLTEGDWRGDVARIEAGLRKGLAPAEHLPGVREVRVLGAIGVIELDRPVRMREATRAAIDARVWLRPFREHVYAMPPYVCSEADVARIAEGMLAATEATLAEGPGVSGPGGSGGSGGSGPSGAGSEPKPGTAGPAAGGPRSSSAGSGGSGSAGPATGGPRSSSAGSDVVDVDEAGRVGPGAGGPGSDGAGSGRPGSDRSGSGGPVVEGKL